mmetsp:Transcript_12321/g.21006  ORF Transcript_12321/g.21006 Transcript_12321/m.21006 type:complete len:238 (-) Transcript_12321:1574-2287(-)
MATLKASIDKVLPNIRKLVTLCSEEINALTSGDFRVQTILFRNFAEHDELLRCDFTSGYTWYDRVRSAALDVSKESIVGVLQRSVVLGYHEVVPKRGKNTGDSGTAQLAATVHRSGGRAVTLVQLCKGLDLVDLDNVEELLTRETEVLAEAVVHFFSELAHLIDKQGLNQWFAATTADSCLGASTNRGDSFTSLVAHRGADAALGDIVTRTNLGIIIHVQNAYTATSAATCGTWRRQ